MRLVVGLGNPGPKYIGNRHTIGHMVIDRLKASKPKPSTALLAKSDAFMNDSGSFVSKHIAKNNFVSTDLYVIHDDLDLPLGTFKIQLGKGPKGHGGINDIEHKLGTDSFWRIRVGVDNRNTENRVPGEAYVLNDFTPQEMQVVERVIGDICKKLEQL